MLETEFISKNEARWQIFEKVLKQKRKKSSERENLLNFPSLYRAQCRDLNLARARRYSLSLIDRLNALVWKGHHFLYRDRGEKSFKTLFLFAQDFPATVRRFFLPLLLCHLLFYGAAFITYTYALADEVRARAILGEESSERLLENYDPQAEHFLRPRGVTSDADMFGFYISNNISIGFQTFASGALAGIGSLFFVLINAVFMGAAAALVVTAGFSETFFPFVIGHGAFELTGILIFSVAGFLLGGAIVAPGRLSRIEALKKAGNDVLPLVVGATLFLFFAACIEAFWSARLLDVSLKYAVGALLWAFVFLFFIFGGRYGRRKS